MLFISNIYKIEINFINNNILIYYKNMILTKPFKYSIPLRKLIQSKLDFQLRINFLMRLFSIYPKNSTITIEELITFIKENKDWKKKFIVIDEKFDKYIKNFFIKNPNGTFLKLVQDWYKQTEITN